MIKPFAALALRPSTFAHRMLHLTGIVFRYSRKLCRRIPEQCFDAVLPRYLDSRMTYEDKATQDLSAHQRREMISLARRVCPWVRQELYLEERFRKYDRAITLRDAQGLAAFQLVQEFDHEGGRYVYFGPLFSDRGAYLPMFVECLKRLLQAHPGHALHLFAEIENPQVLLAFKTLFMHTSYPRFDTTEIPRHARKAARVFSEKLDHIQSLDPASLRTRSRETLFRARPGDRALLRWLEKRGVSLENGDSQGFLVQCDGSIFDRSRILLDVLIGLRKLLMGSCAGRPVRADLKRGASRA